MTSDKDLGVDFSEIDGNIFIAISLWGKETNNLPPIQCAICNLVGIQKSKKKPISGKIALYAMKAYNEAISRGFKHEIDNFY